jgi:hypothetical protein
MLNADTFEAAIRARLDTLDRPRDVIAVAVEAIALRSLLDSVLELTDNLDTLLDDMSDPGLITPIREVLEAVRDRVTVGMVTVEDIVGRVRS